MSFLTLEQLLALHDRIKQDYRKTKITVHLGTCGLAAGAGKTLKALEKAVSFMKNDQVELVKSGCAGLCSGEPMITVKRPNEIPVHYIHVDSESALKILDQHAIKGKVFLELDSMAIALEDDIPFYRKQKLLALRNRGKIDPEKIDDALENGVYQAIAKVLSQNNPSEILNEVKKSGIRGRGGGGFPTGVKWESCLEAVKRTGKNPVVVCNADEGDPGAYMDRSLLESDPHSVIEGMILGALAIGANSGFIYVRREYPVALSVLKKAIKQAREKGLLGDNILGSDFSFDLVIHQGAGAFVCGESSALMASMAGQPGEPRAKYIRSVERGYKNLPTVLNNVETWVNIPVIINRGAEWFSSIGSGDVSKNPWNGNSGTKVFSLVGDVANTGLVEVPMGITLREIIFDIGGGIPSGRRFKAVQTGGPSGGCLPENKLDLPVDFDTLTKAGSMMGSGGMVVMDDSTCMVQIARYFVTFLMDESCGKCTPCREGLVLMNQVLDGIIEGKGKEDDIELLEDLGKTMTETSLCELGKSAANPVISTINYFRDEYEAHLEGKCPALQCKALVSYRIISGNCIGCTLCAKVCPAAAIKGNPGEIHMIEDKKCIRCGMCLEACKYNAVEVS